MPHTACAGLVNLYKTFSESKYFDLHNIHHNDDCLLPCIKLVHRYGSSSHVDEASFCQNTVLCTAFVMQYKMHARCLFIVFSLHYTLLPKFCQTYRRLTSMLCTVKCFGIEQYTVYAMPCAQLVPCLSTSPVPCVNTCPVPCPGTSPQNSLCTSPQHSLSTSPVHSISTSPINFYIR
jgi:hypothetical protein